MSTVIEADDNPGEPLRSADELIEYVASGEKTRDQFRVGTEHEKFGFTRVDGKPLPFEGDNGIEAILEEIASTTDWTAVKDDGRTIALTFAGASITLEPGGQLELSGAPLKTVHETCVEVGEHLDLLKAVCIPRGIGFIGIGFHPTATWAEMASVPKPRYAIMRRYMPTVGGRGLDMMKRTATVQANFDYASERDMVESFRMALAISPVVTAIFANSTFVEGQPTGWVSERARVWGDTDPDRSGFPQCVLDDDFSYERWVEYTLDVPMYFVRRDGQHHDYAGASFREFMSETGLDGRRATLRDYKDHLTAVFPEVRLKTYLEVRGADCGPWSRICALPALWKGLIYDDTARAAAYALMDTPTAKELRVLHHDVARRGLDAEHRGRSVHSMAARLVELSREGLRRQSEGEVDEVAFLAPCVEVIERKKTFGEWLVDLYEGEWNGDLSRIYEEIEFWK